MDMVPLKASAREKTAKAAVLRLSGEIPCILYGHEVKSTLLQCKEGSLKKVYERVGESTLVELEIGSQKIPVLFYDISMDPVSDRITHADFYAVNMKEEVETDVPIRFQDIAPALAQPDTVFVTTMDHVTVRCLPANLPHELSVSIESLLQIGDSISVSDVPAPEGVRILNSPETVIALIQKKREEEVIEEVKPAEGLAAEGEGEKEAPEGSESAEGTETPAGQADVKKREEDKKGSRKEK